MKASIRDCEAYAAYLRAGSELCESTSGGAFYGIASYFIEAGGVCYGAVMDDDFGVHHQRAETLKELGLIRKSKYVQSELGNTYNDVKNYLADGRLVLFSGTPCQIAGLRSFLEVEYNNLYMIDVFCHGVPNNRMFREHVAGIQKMYGKHLVDYQFRNKCSGWKPVEVGYLFEPDYRWTVIAAHEDPYFYAFDLFLNLRPSCYTCKFRGMNSGADITIGDYWGIEGQHPDFNNENRGISAIIIKTEKGHQIWDKVKERFEHIPSTVQQMADYNVFIVRSLGRKKARQVFFDTYANVKEKNPYIAMKAALDHVTNLKGTKCIDLYGSFALRCSVNPILTYDYNYYRKKHIHGTPITTAFSEPVSDNMYNRAFSNMKNGYRREALRVDWKKQLDIELKSSADGAVLLIDLLEDALPYYQLNDECRISCSEACIDSGLTDILDSGKSETYAFAKEKWKESCCRFVEIIEREYGFTNVIVVQLFLSEKYGYKDEYTEYDNVDNIRRINETLRERYSFLIDNMPGCRVLNVKSIKELITDGDSIYGCKPEYYSQSIYQSISQDIYEELGEKRWM